MLLWIMKVFLPKKLRTKKEVEEALVCMPHFVLMPSGEYKMLTLTKASRDARDYATTWGISEDRLIELSLEHSKETGLDFEAAFTVVVHAVASLCLENEESNRRL